MAVDREKATERVNKAGKIYKEFLKREAKSKFFTDSQRHQRKRSFLDSHIGIFDDYLSTLQNSRRLEGLNADARQLAVDIATEHPTSGIGRKLNRRRPDIEEGEVEERNILNEIHNREIDLQGKAFENYKKRTANEELNDTVRHEGDVQASVASRVSDDDFSNVQKKAVRDICAYMYRHTKTHQKFVDGIAARPLWEKLLMCYIVENDKLHDIDQAYVLAAKQYVPSLNKFKEKVKYNKHWYKLGVKDINWNLISDAAMTAFRGIETSGTAAAKEKFFESTLVFRKEDIISGGKEKPENFPEDAFDQEEIISEGGNEIEEDIPEDAFNKSQIIDSMQDKISILHDVALKTRESIQNGDDVKQIEENLKLLDESFIDINVFTVQDQLFRELQSGAPGGGTDMKALNTELQYRTKYVGLMRQILGFGQSVLKSVINQRIIDAKKAFPGGKVPEGVPKPTGAFTGSQKMTEISTSVGFYVDAPVVLLNALNTVVKVSGFFKGYKASTAREAFVAGGEAFNAVVGLGKSGLSTTTTGASLFANADWGSAGKSALAGTFKTTTGALGIAAGGVSAVLGGIQLYDTAQKRKGLTSVENEIAAESQRINNDNNISDQQKAELRGKHQMMQNIVAANRSSVKNKQATAGLQTAQGTLTAASGTLTLLAGPSLGVAGIASLGLSLVALSVGIISAALKKKGKKNEIKGVIDDYIGMDTLYRDYVEKNRMSGRRLSREAFIKNQGGEDKIRDRIRKDVAGTLGYPSLKKFYNEIMYQYAQFLHREAFYKDGRKIKVAEVWDIPNNRILDQTKYSCGKLIQNLGLKLTFGGKSSDPKPSVDEIYKKLIG